jgi:predicted nucleic acid-binding protein
MRVYLDAAPVIYLVEQVKPFATAVTAKVGAAGTVLVASDLTRMECLVRPLRAGDTRLAQDYEDFFAAQIGEMVLFATAVFRRAASIRARENFKTPDALHLAAAVEAGCDSFLTNDAQLARFTGIAVEVIT